MVPGQNMDSDPALERCLTSEPVSPRAPPRGRAPDSREVSGGRGERQVPSPSAGLDSALSGARGAGVRAGRPCRGGALQPVREVPAPQEPELPHGGASHPEREQFRPGAGQLRRSEKETPRSTEQNLRVWTDDLSREARKQAGSDPTT